MIKIIFPTDLFEAFLITNKVFSRVTNQIESHMAPTTPHTIPMIDIIVVITTSRMFTNVNACFYCCRCSSGGWASVIDVVRGENFNVRTVELR